MKRFSIALVLFASALRTRPLSAADWLTDGADTHRTAWQRDESVLRPDTVKGLHLLWKLQLDNPPHQMHSLFPALIIGALKMPGNTERETAIVAGVSDNLFAIDVASGTLLWQKHFSYTSPKPLPTKPDVLCPGGLTDTPVIGPAREDGTRPVYVISADGLLHQVNAATGEELTVPRTFLPPSGKPYALNLNDNFLYTTTAQGCGGNPNAVWGLDLANPESHPVSFDPGGRGGLWGRTGAAIGNDGTLYAPTGDGPFDPDHRLFSEALIAVAPKTVQLRDYYGPPNAAYMWKRDLDMNVTPVVFDYHGQELVASSSKECRVFLMDAKSLGGPDHRTALDRTPLVCNEEVNFAAAGVWGSMASWQDSDGTRYVLAPFWGPVHSQFRVPVSYGAVTHGAIVAFKVEDKNGKPGLTPVWMSRDMNQAEPPVITNGVVFTYGSGANNVQATPAEGLEANAAPKRISKSGRAIIYALDARTGRELWSSGDQITSFAHFSGLSLANGRVYLGTFDGLEYSFGIAGPNTQVTSR